MPCLSDSSAPCTSTESSGCGMNSGSTYLGRRLSPSASSPAGSSSGICSTTQSLSSRTSTMSAPAAVAIAASFSISSTVHPLSVTQMRGRGIRPLHLGGLYNRVVRLSQAYRPATKIIASFSVILGASPRRVDNSRLAPNYRYAEGSLREPSRERRENGREVRREGDSGP